MEALTKTQIVLVTLLVSFVTSIATGIFTVSLMEQAPQGFTETVHQVVEKTIEHVVTQPAVLNQASAQAVITKETIVVRDEDRAADAISKNVKSIVRIRGKKLIEDVRPLYGLGVVMRKDGIVFADASKILPEEVYEVVFNDGTTYDAETLESDKETGIAFLKIVPVPPEKPTFTPALVADSDGVRLAQSVVAVGGREKDAVALGVVSSLSYKNVTEGSEASTTIQKKVVSMVETNLGTKDILAGSPLFNLTGEIIGVRLDSDTQEKNSFTPVNQIIAAIPALSKATTTPTIVH